MSGCGHFTFPAGDPLCAELGFGAAALRYAAAGFAVIPLEPGEKRPHRMLGRQDDGLGGIYRASTFPAVIAAWWRHDPAANIGVAMGMRNGLAVLDLDTKNGQNGISAWGGYLAAHPELPWPAGPWCRTPSGGAHVWLRTSGPVKDRSSRAALMPGVDVRGDGGLVVAPPSVSLRAAGGGLLPPGEHGGGGPPGTVALSYEWNGCPLCGVPWAPAWFGAALEHWPAAPAAAGGPGAGDGADHTAELPSVAELVGAGGFPPGERNDGMYRLACKLVREQLRGGPVAEDELRKVWEAGSKDGFRWGEVLVLAGSARRYIARQMAAEAQTAERFRKQTGAAAALRLM